MPLSVLRDGGNHLPSYPPATCEVVSGSFLLFQSRKGVSASQLKRMLRINYRTAWSLPIHSENPEYKELVKAA
jgi:hypothetical protein